MQISNSQNLSFKGRLLTLPEKFIAKTDSEIDKQYIKDVFEMTKIMLNTKQVSKFTQNDTIEFERKKAKNKFIYKMIYKTPDIKDDDPIKKTFENIKLEGENLRSVFNIADIFHNITLAVAYKRGIFKKAKFFTIDTEIRDMAFEYTKEQSAKFPF